MYKVDVYLRVRRAVMVEGMSIRETARTFGPPTAPSPTYSPTGQPKIPADSRQLWARLVGQYAVGAPSRAELPPWPAISAPNDNCRPPPAPFIGIEPGPSRAQAPHPCSNAKAASHRWIWAKLGIGYLESSLVSEELSEDGLMGLGVDPLTAPAKQITRKMLLQRIRLESGQLVLQILWSEKGTLGPSSFQGI